MNYENNINEITENLIPDNNNNEIQLMPLESDKPSSIFLSKTFKISVIILLISVLFTSNNYLTIENIFFFSPLHTNQCYSDSLFDFTSSINSFFFQNVSYRNILLITTSFFADTTVIMAMYLWVFHFKDEMLVFTMVLFYLCRFIIMELIVFNFPSNYIFSYPGFHSIFVSYLKTNDFFFSGHTGFPAIIFLDFYKKKYYFVAYFSIITLTLQFFTMLVLHGHYSIDLIVGILFGIYLYYNCNKLLHWYYKKVKRNQINSI